VGLRVKVAALTSNANNQQEEVTNGAGSAWEQLLTVCGSKNYARVKL
jgi:hypothetical protein